MLLLDSFPTCIQITCKTTECLIKSSKIILKTTHNIFLQQGNNVEEDATHRRKNFMQRHCLSLTCLSVYAKVTCQCTLGYSNKNCCSFSWSFHSNELILSGSESQAIYLGCPLEHLGPCFSSCKLKNARCGPLAAAALL